MIEDTHNSVTTGTSWKFTAPFDGSYSIQGYVEAGMINLSSSTSGEVYVIISKNSSTYTFVGGKWIYPPMTVSSAWGVGGSLSGNIRLLKDEYIYFTFSYSTIFITSTSYYANVNRIIIERIGAY